MASFTSDFTGTDGNDITTLGFTDGTDLEINGNHAIASTSAAYDSYRAAAADTVDQDIQALFSVANSANATPWIGGRISATGDGNFFRFNGGSWYLYVRSGGTITSLASYTGDVPTTPKTGKLEIRDATKKVTIDTVERISSTNNAVTAANSFGVGAYYSNASSTVYIDDYSAQDAAGAGQTVAIGQASESDTAQAVTRVKSKAVAQAEETDAAQAATLNKTIAVAQTTETDVAQGAAASKALATGQATETDLAQPVTVAGGPQTIAIGQALEVDEALPVNRVKVLGVAQVTETDSAQTTTGAKTKATAQATETDLAQAATKAKVIYLAQPTENDSAQALTPRKITAIAAASETDFAQNVIPFKLRPTTAAAETDIALPVTTTGGGGGPTPAGSGWFRFWRIRRRA